MSKYPGLPAQVGLLTMHPASSADVPPASTAGVPPTPVWYTVQTPFSFSVHYVILLLPVLLTVYTRHPSTLCVSANVVLFLSPSLSLKSLAKEKESQDLFVSVTEFDKQQPNKMDPFASYKIKTEVYQSINFMYVLMCNTNHVSLSVCLSVCVFAMRAHLTLHHRRQTHCGCWGHWGVRF